MKMTKSHHVTPNGNGGWKVQRGGAKKASKNFDLKKDAEKFGREVSKNQGSELVIHGKNGIIQRKDSHGEDPCPPKDKN